MRNGFDISFRFGCLCRFMEPKKSTLKVGGNEEHEYKGSTDLIKTIVNDGRKSFGTLFIRVLSNDLSDPATLCNFFARFLAI